MLQRQQTEYRFEQESGEAVMLLVTPAAPPHIPAEVRTWRITRHGLSTYSTCTTEEINSFEAQVGSLGIPVRGKTWMHALNEAVQCAAEPEPVTAHSTDHPQAKLEFEIRTTPDRHTLLFKLGGIRGGNCQGRHQHRFRGSKLHNRNQTRRTAR